MHASRQRLDAALARCGEPVTLRRPGSPNVDVTALARIDRATEQPTAGNVAQTRRNVIMSNSEIAAAGWPGPPKRGDQIIAGGKTTTVQTVDTITIGTETIRHNLETLGA